ncbi:hypothetical protein VOLCADRAFT_105839 [Volvox carteri f. nagariensis]|uniref:Uncharacterized protein n=1 Tax=Volvox carteri f. nagariensis TaxID=3068 RepID=D8U3H7_VOLCA|nr:uncharacterized protein VOLCADRAFT_105839 [Volvox carteri f. nagariensis]EFJ45758.1 hypothetical protein VOLCADRAFT_105839 [Volvox carteri f. nagariensis]|eukprot:XP_002953159.1 hypothetical protein VOLCADRAFT_105839 [Volvox carteri f. nagariensis]
MCDSEDADQSGPAIGVEQQLGGLSLAHRQACASVVHGFATEPGDHAETPLQAYEHIEPLLARLATRLGTTKAALRIYDPFFCEGRMLAHMASLGFESVHNRNEDFYAMRDTKRTPEFDVLVTNPPFSGDHIEATFEFAIASGRPFFILVPQYVSRKAFYLEWLNNGCTPGLPPPVFVGPKHEPYIFLAPDRADVRTARAPGQEPATAAATQGDSVPGDDAASRACAGAGVGSADGGLTDAVEWSTETGLSPAGAQPETPSAASVSSAAAAEPVHRLSEQEAAAAAAAFQVAAGSFQCVWFVGLGERHQKHVVEWWRQRHADSADCVIVGNVKDLPVLTAAKKLTPAERRWRKKQAALQQGGGEGQPAAASVGGGRPGAGGGGRPGAGGGGRQGAAPTSAGSRPAASKATPAGSGAKKSGSGPGRRQVNLFTVLDNDLHRADAVHSAGHHEQHTRAPSSGFLAPMDTGPRPKPQPEALTTTASVAAVCLARSVPASAADHGPVGGDNVGGAERLMPDLGGFVVTVWYFGLDIPLTFSVVLAWWVMICLAVCVTMRSDFVFISCNPHPFPVTSFVLAVVVPVAELGGLVLRWWRACLVAQQATRAIVTQEAPPAAPAKKPVCKRGSRRNKREQASSRAPARRVALMLQLRAWPAAEWPQEREQRAAPGAAPARPLPVTSPHPPSCLSPPAPTASLAGGAACPPQRIDTGSSTDGDGPLVSRARQLKCRAKKA